MILIGGGRVFAKVADQAQGQGLLQTILILTAYVAPYFFIPATFKFAGGLFATVTGAMNDRTRGFFDRQKKYRGEALKERKERAGSENLFNKNSRFRRTAALGNKLTTWTAYPGANAKYAIGKFGQRHGIGLLSGTGAGIRSSINQKILDQTGKLSQELQAAGFNDKALATVAGIHTGLSQDVQNKLRAAGLYGKRLTSRPDIVAAAEILQGSSSATEQIGANAMLGYADRIGGLYRDTEMNYSNVAAAAVMEWSRQGFASSADVAAFGNAERQSSNKEIAQELVTRAQLMGQQARPDLKAGYGVVYADDQQGFKSGIQPGERGKALVKTIKQYEWTSAKTAAIQELRPSIEDLAREQAPDGTRTADADTMVRIIAMNAASATDPGSRAEWRDIASQVFGKQGQALDAEIYQLSSGYVPVAGSETPTAGAPPGAADASGAPSSGPPGAPPGGGGAPPGAPPGAPGPGP